MPVEIVNLQRSMRLPRRAIAAAVALVAREEIGREVRVSLAFVTDRHIAEVNATWLAHRGPTDVISFSLADKNALPDDVFGELVVSTDRALDEARRRGLGAERELLLYVVHGMLHLAGFDDATPAGARKMRRLEAKHLNRLATDRRRADRR